MNKESNEIEQLTRTQELKRIVTALLKYEELIESMPNEDVFFDRDRFMAKYLEIRNTVPRSFRNQ